MNDLHFPVIGMIERQGDLVAYVAWSERDLETCPFHEFLRTRRAKHTLFGANGAAQVVQECRYAGVDWQRVREVGPVTQAVSALVSLFNFPARIVLQRVHTAPVPLSELKQCLKRAVDLHPRLYTARKSASAVRSALAKSSTFYELAVSISNAPPSAA